MNVIKKESVAMIWDKPMAKTKSDYLYIKAGNFFIPWIYAPNLPDEALYKWDDGFVMINKEDGK